MDFEDQDKTSYIPFPYTFAFGYWIVNFFANLFRLFTLGF